MPSNSHLTISYEEQEGMKFIRLFAGPQVSEEVLSQTFNHSFIRYYSRSGLSIAYIMQKTDFNRWFNLSNSFRIYGVIQEGDFHFLDSFLDKKQISYDLIRYEYGPRQYLQSFSAFSIYCPINFFNLRAPTCTFTSTNNGFEQALEEARIDIDSHLCEQVLIAGSLPQKQNLLFYAVTNNTHCLTKDFFEKLVKS